MLANTQVGAEGRLQLTERLESRISLLTRHAPTWRPLDPQRSPHARNGPSPNARPTDRPKIIDLAVLSPASLTDQLTREKGRKEGARMTANLAAGSRAPLQAWQNWAAATFKGRFHSRL